MSVTKPKSFVKKAAKPKSFVKKVSSRGRKLKKTNVSDFMQISSEESKTEYFEKVSILQKPPILLHNFI